MNRETIEKAARKYATDKYGGEYTKQWAIAQIHSGRDGFIDGAQWRINAAWHDGKEMPGYKQPFIYQAVRRSGEVYYGMKELFGDDEWDFMNEFCTLERWAYLSDLIPDGKEEHP